MFRYLLLLTSLFATNVFSSNAFPIIPDVMQPYIDPNQAKWTYQDLENQPFLYQCSEDQDEVVFCSIPLNYYGVEVEAELHLLNDTKQNLKLFTEFSRSRYTDLITNLRKDGYQLIFVQDNIGSIDVNAELETKSIQEVDKAVFFKMNQGNIADKRTILWEKPSKDASPSLKAKFVSDGKTITLIFER